MACGARERADPVAQVRGDVCQRSGSLAELAGPAGRPAQSSATMHVLTDATAADMGPVARARAQVESA